MASRKIDRAAQGPRLIEVVLGALLSLILGAALAFVFLVMKPVTTKEPPKDNPDRTVYFVEGTKDPERGKQWLRKRQLFTEGSSVVLNEDELNAWITAGTTPAPEKPAPGQSPVLSSPPAPTGMLQMSAPNFRIRDGVLQVSSHGTLYIEMFSFKCPLVVQASGRFAKRQGAFVFAPDRFYIGSFPVHRLPGASDVVIDRILARQKIPSDIGTAWKNLADVSLDGKTLKLSMP